MKPIVLDPTQKQIRPIGSTEQIEVSGLSVTSLPSKRLATNSAGLIIALPLSFEELDANLRGLPYTVAYDATSGLVTSKTWSNGGSTVTKTYTYVNEVLQSATFSGALPAELYQTTKTFAYNGAGELTGATYS